MAPAGTTARRPTPRPRAALAVRLERDDRVTHERDFLRRHVAVVVRRPDHERDGTRNVAEVWKELRRLPGARHGHEGPECRVEIARLAEGVAQNDAVRHPGSVARRVEQHSANLAPHEIDPAE